MKAKAAAILFFLFLLLVILAADNGRMPGFLRILYDFPNGDRVGHVVLYGALSFLVSIAFPRVARQPRFLLPVPIIALLLFSLGEEWSQTLFPSRTADPIDLACSFAGILTAYGMASAWMRRRKSA